MFFSAFNIRKMLTKDVSEQSVLLAHCFFLNKIFKDPLWSPYSALLTTSASKKYDILLLL